MRHLKWALLGLALNAFGADVTMTVNPPVISLGEAAQVIVIVRDAKRPTAPAFPTVAGLRFSGTSKSSEASFWNGKVDQSTRYTTTVFPQRTGDFEIGPFPYTVDGETKLLSAKLKVVATSGDATASQNWSDVIFSTITSSRDKPYVQEPFELTLSIYSLPDLQIHRIENLRGMPETGLTVETDWKGDQPIRETLNGTLYDVRRYKASMRAIGSGHFEFSPTVTAQVVSPQQRPQRDPFFDSLFNTVQTTPIDLNTEAVAIDVLPLPAEDKPDGFTGAVGRFQFQVTAAPTDVTPGDPITLQMTVVGEGNYDRIQPPALPVNAPFRLFGDAVRSQGQNGIRFEQVISPRNATVQSIPPIDFSFFDSTTGRYRTISSQPIPITVSATSNNTAQVFVAKDNVTVAPADTPFATESDIQRITGWLKKQWEIIRHWLWILPAALGLGALLCGMQKLIHIRRKNPAWMRRQDAPKAARNALKTAETALRKNDRTAFYEALGNALNAYFGNRMNLTPGDVTPSTVLNTLRQANTATEQVKALFDQVEAARYGRAHSDQTVDQMNTLKCELETLLKQMDKMKL